MEPFGDDFEGFWGLFRRCLGRFFDEFVFDFGRGVSLVASGEPLVFEACTWYLCYRERSFENGKLIFERLSMRNT